MIADCGKNATWQTGAAHLLIWRRQLVQYVLIDQLPVRVLGGLGPLLAPPHHVPRIENETRPAALDISHDLAGDPFAALQPEHRAVHPRKEFYVLDRGLRDPTFVQRQSTHLTSRVERHHHLHQLFWGRIMDQKRGLADGRFARRPVLKPPRYRIAVCNPSLLTVLKRYLAKGSAPGATANEQRMLPAFFGRWFVCLR